MPATGSLVFVSYRAYSMQASLLHGHSSMLSAEGLRMCSFVTLILITLKVCYSLVQYNAEATSLPKQSAPGPCRCCSKIGQPEIAVQAPCKLSPIEHDHQRCGIQMEHHSIQEHPLGSRFFDTILWYQMFSLPPPPHTQGPVRPPATHRARDWTNRCTPWVSTHLYIQPTSGASMERMTPAGTAATGLWAGGHRRRCSTSCSSILRRAGQISPKLGRWAASCTPGCLSACMATLGEPAGGAQRRGPRF